MRSPVVTPAGAPARLRPAMLPSATAVDPAVRNARRFTALPPTVWACALYGTASCFLKVVVNFSQRIFGYIAPAVWLLKRYIDRFRAIHRSIERRRGARPGSLAEPARGMTPGEAWRRSRGETARAAPRTRGGKVGLRRRAGSRASPGGSAGCRARRPAPAPRG